MTVLILSLKSLIEKEKSPRGWRYNILSIGLLCQKYHKPRLSTLNQGEKFNKFKLLNKIFSKEFSRKEIAGKANDILLTSKRSIPSKKL